MDNREEQIRLAEQLIATGIDGELKKAIENQFPELKESEDEKIRGVISYAICAAAHQDGTLINGVTKEEALAYLEKQKEQRSIEDVIKNITKNKEAATKFLKSAGIMDDNGELSEMYRSEQKSAEWSEEDERILKRLIRDYEEAARSDGGPWGKVFQENLAWLKSLRPQPKQEWSEEDEAKKERLISIVKRALHGNEYPLLNDNGATELIAWLKSLRPQPKQEWSEEEAEMLERCIDSIKSYRDYYAAKDPDSRRVDDKYNPYNVEIKWLKSLRPQPHWKPSEEQIGALKQWLQDKQYDGDSRYAHPILESLYNDLQKLL